MAKNCPHCGLVNPPQAQRCDCGYDFQSGQMKRSYLQPKTKLRKAAAIGGGSAVAALVIYFLFIRGLGIIARLFGG